MIQDIAPHHYDNAYHPTQPKAGDRVFFYHEGSTLLSAATGEPFTAPDQPESTLPSETSDISDNSDNSDSSDSIPNSTTT